MNQVLKTTGMFLKVAIGCALFGLGFNLFLAPNELNAGGLSGLAMILVHVLKIGTVGSITLIMNLPLFAIGGLKIGKKFFWGSLIGMAMTAVFLDLFARIPAPHTEPLVAAIYGGAVCGIGLGMVFVSGVSTGGSDIVVRLLKLRYQNVPIGTISMCFDLCVVVLTGLVFWDITPALYSGVVIFITGQVIDAVVYRFDYSKVALIITKQYELVAQGISDKLERGATFLHGEGTYHHEQTKVVLTAVKKTTVGGAKGTGGGD